MSDFLGRLLGAAHAPVVRPLLPLRFEPEGRNLGGDTDDHVAALEAPAMPTDRRASTHPGDVPPFRTASLPPHEAAPPRGAGAASPPDAVGPSHAVMPAAPPTQAAGRGRAPAAAARPSQAVPGPVEQEGSEEHPRHRIAHPVSPGRAEGEEPEPSPAWVPRSAPPTATVRPQAAVPPLSRPADRAGGTPRPDVPAGPRATGPAPVHAPAAEAPRAPMPPRPPAAEALRAAPAPPRLQARRDRAGERTVHITIGRVEVRAMPHSTTPERREPPRRPVLGLGDYLRERAGGERP